MSQDEHQGAADGAMRRVLSEILAKNQLGDRASDGSESPRDGTSDEAQPEGGLDSDRGSSRYSEDDGLGREFERESEPKPDGLVDALHRAGLPSTSTAAPIPERFGRYIVLGPLGRGGMGVVLEAFDRTLDRKVAVKVLHRHLAESHTQRLIREAKALARLSHPNVVQVHEVGRVGEQDFVAMELLTGQTLKQWQSERRPWRECVQVYLQAGRGLAAAHAKELVHRDFKPGNCILDDEGRVRVLDFGLVQKLDAQQIEQELGDAERGTVERGAVERGAVERGAVERGAVERGAVERGAVERVVVEQTDDGLTPSGAVLGTLAYMSPEQLRGESVDARADQFSFCVSLYEALYAQRPFVGDTVSALVEAVKEGQLRPIPRRSGVPSRLQAVVLRGLATRPDDRFASMEALLERLDSIARSRRALWIGGLLVVGVVTMVGAAMWQEIQVCTGAEELLADAWNEERRGKVRDAILGTDLSYAAGTWERVEQGLDDYAQGWASKHEEVCRATKVRGEQSTEVMELRMECLLRRRIELREAVGVLADANEGRVRKAVELVAGLPAVSRCDAVEALQAKLPPPEDAQVAAQVDALRERLDQARFLRTTGEYADALAVAEQVVTQAEALGYAPLLAEAMLQRGAIYKRRAQYGDAERDLQQAYVQAAQLGHEAVEARAVADLTIVVGEGQARHEQGLQWGTTALALARGPHVEPQAEGDALNNIGNVLRRQGRLGEALDHHQQALAIREQELGPTHLSVASSLANIGLVLHDRGQLEEALTHQRRALTIQEQVLGRGHPRVAASLGNIGLVLYEQGQLDEALVHQQQALELEEEALGSDHPHVASSLNNIGLVLQAKGDLGGALEVQTRALALYERVLGEGHPSVARSLNNIGNVLREQGRLEEALSHQQRALEIRQRALGATHPDVAASLNNIGVVLLDQGKSEEARSHYRRALTIFEQALGAEHATVAYPLIDLAKVALAESEPAVAQGHAERAVAVLSSGEVSPERLAEARFVLAQALWSEPEQRERARSLAGQARTTYAALGSRERPRLEEVERWLTPRSDEAPSSP